MRYLSQDWLDRADAALTGLTPVPSDLAVGVTVTDGPDGDRRYRLVLGPDRVAVSGDPEPAGVRMTLAWDDAVAIAQGRSSAQRAFLDGRLRLGGDTSLLLGHQEALAAIDDRLGALRGETEFA
ncbi:MAG: SCP2 sterol-binding domain-containing protein [Actinomycetota bacterium]